MSNNKNIFSSQTLLEVDVLKRQVKQFADKCLAKLSIFAIDKEEVDLFINEYLKPYVLTDPFYWFTNPLIKLIKEHVGNELPTCFLYSIEKFENSTIFQTALTEEKNKYLGIIYRNENISEEECESLLVIMRVDKSFPKVEILKYLIKKIIAEELILKDEVYCEVFLSFIRLFQGLEDMQFYLSCREMPACIKNNKEMITFAYVKERFGAIYMKFNIKTLKCENIILNLFTFFHELWHLLQDREEYTSLYYRELFFMDKMLDAHCSYYHGLNYKNFSYEIDANINSLRILYRLLVELNIGKEYYKLIKEGMEIYYKKMGNLVRFDQFENEVPLDLLFDKWAKGNGINPYEMGLINSYNEKGERLSPLDLYYKWLNGNQKSYYEEVIKNANYSSEDYPNILSEIKGAIEAGDDSPFLKRIYTIYFDKYWKSKENQTLICVSKELTKLGVEKVLKYMKQ